MSKFMPGTDLSVYEPDSLTGGRPKLKKGYEMVDGEIRYVGDKGTKVEGATTGDPKSEDFNIDRFQSLLDRLESSKKRQQRQRSVEGRRDIFAQGLAGMMSNF